MSPDAPADWGALGINPEDAQAFRAAGLTSTTAQPWISSGIPAAEVRLWVAQRMKPAVAAEWYAAGVILAFLAARWRDEGFTPTEASAWSLAGVQKPDEAQLWRTMRWLPDQTGPWLAAGFRSPRQAGPWREEGFDPDVAAAWLAAGIDDPELATQLAGAGAGPNDLRKVMAGGVPVRLASQWLLSSIDRTGPLWQERKRWIDVAMSPQSAGRWSAVGCEPDLAARCERKGYGIDAVESWCAAGADTDTVVAWCDEGIPVGEVRRWLGLGCAPSVILDWRRGGFTPEEFATWKSAGVDHLDACRRWTSAGVSPAEVARYVALGCGPAAAEDLFSFGYRLAQVERWVSKGARLFVVMEWGEARTPSADIDGWLSGGWEPDQIRQWQKAGFDAVQAARWSSAGMRRPRECRLWADEHFEPQDSAAWRERGFTDAADAAAWRSGAGDPDTARQWVDAGFDPDDARRWIEAGVRKPASASEWLETEADVDTALAWIKAGQSPKSANAWKQAGVSSPSTAQGWIKAGFMSPESIAEWEQAGFGPTMAAAWKRAGFPLKEARVWDDGSLSPNAAALFRRAGWSIREAGAWGRAGIDTPQVANTLIGRHLRVGLVADLLKRGWKQAELLDLPQGASSAEQMETLVRALADGDRLRRWKAEGLADQLWFDWATIVPDHPHVLRMWQSGGVLLSELRTAVRQYRLRPQELPEWLESGGTARGLLNRYRGIAAPQAATAPAKPAPPQTAAEARAFRQWITNGKTWTDSAGMTSREHPFLRGLHAQGMRWAAPGERVFRQSPDNDWLTEILARAEDLSPLIRLVPQWPATFDDNDLKVSITYSADWVYGWASRAGTGLVASFRPTDFEVRFQSDNPDAKVVLGLTLSWFLDCSVSLAEVNQHPHFQKTPPAQSGRAASDTGVTYVPYPSFRSHVRAVRIGSITPPRAHRVKDHPRRLPEGQFPSDEAVSRAPAYIRINMTDRDTFVRGHHRGDGESRERIRVHLSRYSSLGDALGWLGAD